MSENPFKGIEEILKYCRSFSNEKTNNSNGSENQNNFSNEGYYCGDIPGGFQSVDPQFFLITSELVANIVAGNIPFNVQNVIGNWLQLIGQVIETFNAQQQYMQSGPGRYYDIKNLNVNNPFCSWNQSSSGQSDYEDSSQYVNRNTTGNSQGGNSKTQGNYDNEIAELKEEIEDLRSMMGIILDRLDKINKKN